MKDPAGRVVDVPQNKLFGMKNLHDLEEITEIAHAEIVAALRVHRNSVLRSSAVVVSCERSTVGRELSCATTVRLASSLDSWASRKEER